MAALYVQTSGVYRGLLGVAQVWSKDQDARTYKGPHPVVAHPSCAHWGRLSVFASGDTKDCAPRAVEQVQQWGGVLEHPAHSQLWVYKDLPRPGQPCDEFGGYTVAVLQSWWGHRAPKASWLYVVGVGAMPERPAPWGQWSHDPGGRVQNMCRAERERTPIAFALWLVAWASTCPSK